jgi:cytochrome c553
MVVRLMFVGLFSAILVASLVSRAAAGDAAVGEQQFKEKNCHVCHGPGGKGMASYPKLAGKDVDYLVDRLNTYRSGTKVGPNSDLMIMNAKPLTDEEIDNLAMYLNSAKPK